MKISSLGTYIVSKNSEEVVKTFEKLGFEVKHKKMDANSGKNPSVVMKNEDGFRVSIAQSDNAPRDIQAIRINVDNFEEAYQKFIDMGFQNPMGDQHATSSSDKSVMLFAPTGFAVLISEHIK